MRILFLILAVLVLWVGNVRAENNSQPLEQSVTSAASEIPIPDKNQPVEIVESQPPPETKVEPSEIKNESEAPLAEIKEESSPKDSEIDYAKKIDDLIQEIKTEIDRLTIRSEKEEEEIYKIVPEEILDPKPPINQETNWDSSKDESGNLLATNKGLRMGNYKIITPDDKNEEIKNQ